MLFVGEMPQMTGKGSSMSGRDAELAFEDEVEGLRWALVEAKEQLRRLDAEHDEEGGAAARREVERLEQDLRALRLRGPLQ